MPPKNVPKGRGGRSAQARNVMGSAGNVSFMNRSIEGGGKDLKAGLAPNATGFNNLHYKKATSMPDKNVVFNWKGNTRWRPIAKFA
tara:strand:- start:344 stop:601 length:258 start_codon:yes stop_codon:yes gene_type:complete